MAQHLYVHLPGNIPVFAPGAALNSFTLNTLSRLLSSAYHPIAQTQANPQAHLSLTFSCHPSSPPIFRNESQRNSSISAYKKMFALGGTEILRYVRGCLSHIRLIWVQYLELHMLIQANSGVISNTLKRNIDLKLFLC